VLNRNLVAGEAPLKRVFKFYQEINRQNVIKLLLRVIKMYQARNDAKIILEGVIKLNEISLPVKAILEGTSPFIAEQHTSLLQEVVKRALKIIALIR